MLTKSEINQKKARSEQLDLVEAVSSVDESHKKRQLLYISLFVTIGLSFIFWFYRQLNVLLVNPLPQFKLPQLELPAVSSDDLDSQITNLLSTDANVWNVTIYLPATDKLINWSRNSLTVDYQSAYKTLSSSKKSDSFVSSVLPQGLTIVESYQENSRQIISRTFVDTPQKPILFLITIEGNQPSQSKELLLKLISHLYWQTIKD